MKMKLTLAALLVLASATTVSAQTIKYTFTGYCDGVILTEVGQTWGGTHAGSCTNNDPAGGVNMRIAGTTTRYIDLATQDSKNAPGVALSYFLDLKGLTWLLYATSSGVYTEISSGTLTKGAPPASNLPPSDLVK